MKKVSVIGIGRLGLCWALNLEKNGYDVLGVDIKVYRAVISGTTAIADPFLLFHGNLSDFQINDAGTNASLSISATNHFGNFNKINGRTTADTSQQRHFASDKGFEFSALTIRDIKWGRA